MINNNKKKILLVVSIIFVAVLLFLLFSFLNKIKYSGADINKTNELLVVDEIVPEVIAPIIPPVVSHIETPNSVKAVYMSSWVAGSESFKNKILKIIDNTEINAVVIDVKDSTGRISFEVYDQKLKEEGSVEKRIANLPILIKELHSKGIYVIGRIAVFQDPQFVKKHPELGVKRASNKNILWSDKKGIHWLDAGSKEVWDYTVAIGKEAYLQGFDELNFDYIRFPSDGNMKDIYYPMSEGKIKTEVMKSFFEYIRGQFGQNGEKISADVFGMTTTNYDDLGIGQVLETALKNFDYVAPMVYPSHYPPMWNGYKNPATKPYEVIHKAMEGAVIKARASGQNPLKLRPWLQDFNMGAIYTPDMIKFQKKAVYDVGLDSWMMWDPANTYTEGGYEKQL